MRIRPVRQFFQKPFGMVIGNLLLAVVYLAVAHWSLHFTYLNGQASPIWPPTGLAIFALTTFGKRWTPGIWLGATLANRLTGAPWLASSLVGVGNGLEALAAAAILGKAGFRPSMDRIRDVLALVLPVGLLVPMISATVGLGGLWALGVIPGTRWLAAWAVWWIGDAMGAVIIAPVLFTLAHWIRSGDRLRPAPEALLILGLSAVTAWAIFGGHLGSGSYQYSMAYILFPFAIYSAYRAGPIGVAVTTLVTAGLAVSATVAGAGPFARETLHENLVLLATFLSLLSCTGLLMAAAVAERRADGSQLLRHSQLLEHSPEAVAMTDARGHLIYLNHAARVLLEANARRAEGTFLAFLDREGRRRFHKEIGPALAEAGRWAGEMDLPVAGSSIPVAHQIFLIRDPATPDSTAVGWIGHDLREQRRTEASLRQTQKLESLGVLAGGVAHDFNNLLAAMQGYLELAELEGLGRTAHANHMQHLRGLVDRAAGLTQQLLAYAGRSRTDIVPLDLGAMARELMSLLLISVGKKAELRIEAPAELPWVMGDRAQMEQVLMNLVINAAEALEAEPGRIGVRLWPETMDAQALQIRFPSQGLSPGPYLLVAVADNGKGIEPDLLERIFDPFFTTKFTGRGLGLSAIRGILRNHDGGLQVSSSIGKGSEFTIALPAVEPLPRIAAIGQAPAAVASGAILLVEDEDALREVTSVILRNRGHEVVEAGNGQEALERYRATAGGFRAVLLDLAMPVMDGAETFRRLRVEDPNLPVILCSGNLQPGLLEALNAEGLAGFLAKPYRREELFHTLDRVMRH